jgi:hypothetical protein
MKTCALLMLSTLSVVTFSAQALADGFAYAGSPKLGAYYVRSAPSAPGADWRGARAELSQPMPAPRGGIGRRMP